jgi:hypothetical protein
LPQVRERILWPYTEEEFVATFPTAHLLLRAAVRSAVEEPDRALLDYFGEQFADRVATSFSIEGAVTSAQMTQVAAAIAVIQFAEIPQALVSNHLRERPESATSAQVETASS